MDYVPLKSECYFQTVRGMKEIDERTAYIFQEFEHCLFKEAIIDLRERVIHYPEAKQDLPHTATCRSQRSLRKGTSRLSLPVSQRPARNLLRDAFGIRCDLGH